ncbi:hypothetical protein GVO57_00345 [Sphingomonas changnyeongensis]|uniref:Uncharacterized protein n=1 Tax=Sphingomonas changnyeongensis TaxID=2698679 RepID=A0A7Z2NUA3_9SPHN|nr:hypothetical protein [Sphingomonas changnyeongensis]QHL89560.1 hypothetical protein GVO57_00345 [Sphingomonas changnyeongensis]
MGNQDMAVRPASETRARLEAGLDMTRALGEHLNWILHLAREAAEHRTLALDAASAELREAHLEVAAAYQKRIEEARRAIGTAPPSGAEARRAA